MFIIYVLLNLMTQFIYHSVRMVQFSIINHEILYYVYRLIQNNILSSPIM